MLTYSLPAILGPVGAAEEGPADSDDQDFDHDGPDRETEADGDGETRSGGAQATATYYAAVQVRLMMVGCGGKNGWCTMGE